MPQSRPSLVVVSTTYCNSVLAGVPYVYLQRLQSVQNAAAHLVSGARRHDHIMPVLVSLHWLPIRQRIIYKTVLLVWKCLHDAAPRYLADLCVPGHSVRGRQQLCSTASGTLLVPHPDCYWLAQLCRQWTTNIELSATRS